MFNESLNYYKIKIFKILNNMWIILFSLEKYVDNLWFTAYSVIKLVTVN